MLTMEFYMTSIKYGALLILALSLASCQMVSSIDPSPQQQDSTPAADPNVTEVPVDQQNQNNPAPAQPNGENAPASKTPPKGAVNPKAKTNPSQPATNTPGMTSDNTTTPAVTPSDENDAQQVPDYDQNSQDGQDQNGDDSSASDQDNGSDE